MFLTKLLFALLLTSTLIAGNAFATCQSSYDKGTSVTVSSGGVGPGGGGVSYSGGTSLLQVLQYEQMALVLNKAERISGVRKYPVRPNRKMRREMRKERRVFNRFFKQTRRKVRGLTKKRLAKTLTELNKKNTLCNGTIKRYYGKSGKVASRKWLLRYLRDVALK